MKQPHLLLLLAILALGTGLRFFRITQTPPGLYPDEAMNGSNAQEALATGHFKLFYPENNGREGLFINLQAISVALFGNEPWALRVVSAVVGTLTILAVYLAAKEIFAPPAVALFAAFFLATSYWHVNFSRIGLRAIMVPLVTSFALYALLRALRRNNLGGLAAAGVIAGLGVYTYTANHFMLPVYLVPLGWQLWSGNREGRAALDAPDRLASGGATAVFLFAALVVALPIGLHFVQSPQDLLTRAGKVSIWSRGEPLSEFARSTTSMIQMYFVRGDCKWRHNYACKPALHPVVALLFLVGIAALWRSGLERWKKTMMAAWFAFMLLPAVLTREGIPHAIRSIGTIAPALMLSGLGAQQVWSVIGGWTRVRAGLRPAFLLALATVPLATGRDYFIRWASHPEVHEAFHANTVHLAKFLDTLPRDVDKVIVVNTGGVLVRGIPMAAQPVMFLTDTFRAEQRKEKRIRYVTRAEIETDALCGAGRTLIGLVDDTDQKLVRRLQARCPHLVSRVRGDFRVLEDL